MITIIILFLSLTIVLVGFVFLHSNKCFLGVVMLSTLLFQQVQRNVKLMIAANYKTIRVFCILIPGIKGDLK